jgi:hypothetical protein
MGRVGRRCRVSVTEVAELYGVSRRSARAWLAAPLLGAIGDDGLPQSCAERLPTLESIEGDRRRYHTIGVNGDVVDFVEEQVWCGSLADQPDETRVAEVLTRPYLASHKGARLRAAYEDVASRKTYTAHLGVDLGHKEQRANSGVVIRVIDDVLDAGEVDRLPSTAVGAVDDYDGIDWVPCALGRSLDGQFGRGCAGPGEQGNKGEANEIGEPRQSEQAHRSAPSFASGQRHEGVRQLNPAIWVAPSSA